MQYRRKPELIDAYQFQNKVGPDDRPKWLIVALQMKVIEFHPSKDGPPHLLIHTLDGTKRADPGDWIVKDAGGGLYPLTDESFSAAYEIDDVPYEYNPLDEFLVGHMREIRRECPACHETKQKIDGECEACGAITNSHRAT